MERTEGIADSDAEEGGLTYTARDEHDEERAHDREDGGGNGREDLLEGAEPAEYADGLHAGEGGVWCH